MMKSEHLSDTDKEAITRLESLDKEKYLYLYTADFDWSKPLDELRNLPISVGEKWKRLAFTILLPAHEQNAFKGTNFSNIFNWCFKWQQFNSNDWLTELADVFDEDKRIDDVRQSCLDLGVVYPLHYNPTTRQAFNWLNESATTSITTSANLYGTNDEVPVEKLQNLVYIYGGNAVCSIYNKPELEGRIKRLINWRTGYFFERLVNSVYSKDKLIEIKTHEINKLANSKLVRQIVKKAE